MGADFSQSMSVAVASADGVIGSSGVKGLVYAITVKGGTGSNTTTAKLYNGTGTGGTLQEDAISPAVDTITISYGEKGVLYGSGIYLDITTTGGSVTVVYSQ